MKITLEDNINCLILGQDGEPVPLVLEIDLRTLRYIQKDLESNRQNQALDVKEGRAMAVIIGSNIPDISKSLRRLVKCE